MSENPIGEGGSQVGGKTARKGAPKKQSANMGVTGEISEPSVAQCESAEEKRERAGRIAMTLAKLYAKARISLDFTTPWQCLVATILSAQCTDERVNRTTPELFAQLPDPLAMAAAPTEMVEKLIMPTGFYRQKTRSIQGAARKILEKFGGEVPSRMEDLVTLPGVGGKTANVILGHVYGEPGLVVDTHVRRLARRLGLTQSLDPEVIEMDLRDLLPAREWTPFSMRLILHGRQVCHARRPRCEDCQVRPECPRIGVAGA
ncbi:MAG TPA: endonuclease III [Candidatus Binataceae bacterium]|nr:endonuclease III [Candidatus Binataceae bacterium]